MSSVVRGKAIIRPIKPKRAPHTERERRRMAGLSPMAFPIILGVSTMSVMSCTMANTASADMRITQ